MVEALLPRNEAQRCTEMLLNRHEADFKVKIDDWTGLKALVLRVHRDSQESSTQVMGKAVPPQMKPAAFQSGKSVAATPEEEKKSSYT